MTTLEANPVTQTANEVLLEASGLKKHFPVTKGLLVSKVTGWIKAVDGVSFQIRAGETLGIVGESGCGKSTTAKMLLQLEEPTEGNIRYQGQEISQANAEQRRAYRSSGPGGFPGPLELSQPADARSRPDCRAHGHQPRSEPPGNAGSGRQAPQ